MKNSKKKKRKQLENTEMGKRGSFFSPDLFKQWSLAVKGFRSGTRFALSRLCSEVTSDNLHLRPIRGPSRVFPGNPPKNPGDFPCGELKTDVGNPIFFPPVFSCVFPREDLSAP